MATIITVHGTFAHSGSTADNPAGEPLPLQWWEQNSAFEQDIRARVDAADGTLNVVPFKWSGANSELGRRKAGSDLLKEMRALEAKAEPYCVVGHSHGGSVVAAALLESGSRKLPLDNLKRWITVGTPFVQMKKETWLFQRLDLFRKVIFVASMMLFLMFLVYILAELLSGQSTMLLGQSQPGAIAFTALMMSMPIIASYFVLGYLDRRSMLTYRKVASQRARDAFGKRWLSLAHKEDEAIQGLSFLPGAKLAFFDKSFAVSTLTLASVVALPLAYLAIITSPSTMLAIGDGVKTTFYSKRIAPEAAVEVKNLRSMRPSFREATPRNATRRDYREKRDEIERRFPGAVAAAEREARFLDRFFEVNNQPCAGGRLCGGGRDLRINSGLLLHVVTDELASAFGTDQLGNWRDRLLASLILPAILVPVIACLVALVLMMLFRSLAMLFSSLGSVALNDMTNIEVKRAAFGNDTEGETAVGAADRPSWLNEPKARLPAALGDLVTDYSNGVASNSIAKFRRTIGTLASVEPKHTADTAITTYFTWKELVHSSYFDVQEFRKLIAQAVSRTEGFAPSASFKAEPDYARTAQWLDTIEAGPALAVPPTQPGTEPATLSHMPPT
jgi:hypothetical protein